jgi:pimeloyl-ACP methyl ester carboxylesterase/DNA-binding CsgD family transcriptional regulator
MIDAHSPAATPPVHYARTADGQRVAFGVAGQGPMLVQAPGWMSHLEHDGHSPMAAALLRGLAERFAVLRHDGCGFGLSDRLRPAAASAGVDSWVADLDAVARAAAPSRFALLGCSQGAATAIAYAVRHPERVSRLVLHGGFARGALVRDGSNECRDEAHALSQIAAFGWARSDEAFRQVFTTRLLPSANHSQQRQFNELQRLAASPEQAAALLDACNRLDVTALLPQLRCPTLVLHSRHDRHVPFDEARWLASHIADAELVSVDSANHLLLETESAWPRWLAAVQEFLAPAATESQHALMSARLSPRQRGLVELVAQGLDNRSIAVRLAVSEKTVRNHMSLIFERLQVENRGQAIVLARSSGFGVAGNG